MTRACLTHRRWRRQSRRWRRQSDNALRREAGLIQTDRRAVGPGTVQSKCHLFDVVHRGCHVGIGGMHSLVCSMPRMYCRWRLTVSLSLRSSLSMRSKPWKAHERGDDGERVPESSAVVVRMWSRESGWTVECRRERREGSIRWDRKRQVNDKGEHAAGQQRPAGKRASTLLVLQSKAE